MEILVQLMNLTENLLVLFRVERQVRGLRSRLVSAERYLNAQIKQISELNAQITEAQNRKLQLQATVANLEVQGKSVDERTEKLREELNSAQTNKQYTAILTELNTVKLERGQFDDLMIEDLEQIDRITEQIADLNAQIGEREKVQVVAQAKYDERHEEVGERLAELEVEREAAAADIPGMDLQVFEDLADAYDGEAMAEVDEVSKKHREYACGACNLQMPFENFSQLMSGTSSLIRCGACTRILYLQEEMRGSYAKK